jgi:uncharacterized protein
MGTYHIRNTEKEITDKEEIDRLLKLGKYTTIAVANDNVPYIFTISYGYDDIKNVLYFHSSNIGQKIEFIKRNSIACATIIEDQGYNKEKCEHYYNSLIIKGKIEVVYDLEEKKKGLGVLLKHLEEHPDPIRQRNVEDDKSYDKVTILKFRIEETTAKHN